MCDSKRILNDRSAGPGIRPLLENSIPAYRVLQTLDEALFGFLLITGQQPLEQVQTVHILVEDLAKICLGCVLHVFHVRDLTCLKHRHLHQFSPFPLPSSQCREIGCGFCVRSA
jgi:hypothetical protein